MTLMSRLRIISIAALLALAAGPSAVRAQADCAPFEQLYTQSGLTFPWPQGQCCQRTREFGYPWFSCTADMKVQVANVCCQGFKGAIPASLSGLTQLQTLILSTNGLSGSIPNLSGLTMLTDLELSANNLTGNVDGLLPTTLSKCQITLLGTNQGLFSASGNLPQACIAGGQSFTGMTTTPATGTGAIGQLRVATDAKCGPGTNQMCPQGNCCSKWGWCGTTEAHCSTGCQPMYGMCGGGSSSSSGGDTTNTGSTGAPAGAPAPAPAPTMPMASMSMPMSMTMSMGMSRTMGSMTTGMPGMASPGPAPASRTMMSTMTGMMMMTTSSPVDQAAAQTNTANLVNLDANPPPASMSSGPSPILIVGIIAGVIAVLGIGGFAWYKFKPSGQAEEYASLSQYNAANASKMPPHMNQMLQTPNSPGYSKQDSRVGNGEAPVSNHEEGHFADRSPWLRAAILGANDGLVSVAAQMVGVGAGGADRRTIFLSGLSALVAGALSMGAGEFVSVYAQRDTEEADIERERQEFLRQPAPYYSEMDELAEIYCKKGLPPNLARKVAEHFHWNNSLEELVQLHAKEEFNVDSEDLSNAWQATITSIIAFSVGGIMPLLGGGFISDFVPQLGAIVGITAAALAGFGALGAHLGGAPRLKAAVRVMIGGLIALGITLGVGKAFGTTTA
ncbi:carbohydrate-binding module family 18 protein [Gonapodya prolifera JEL478]|uniref:Carbohydrate-binding module family 18 protein n=1 Tax=Gonapodya prolifera (strain JEL478) TaxID=1344416 RepID=A0A139ARE8_GONPJ|nr:carbohydrate-binding module family 18 protein [Gonapodya prolifera JEL478]|eukprot:KXS19316.1 carbohydrate-binding module family 18 protein [Gonapodya prolifera JEL478]